MVFIVDDSNTLREQLVKIVSEINGVSVTGQAQNVAEAIDGIRDLKPGVVILDIQLPDGSGIDVLRSIKQFGYSIMVLMLTNHPSLQYQKKCLALGADYFLDKSRDIDKVRQILKDFFEISEPKDC